jgi:hypothetical protein
MRPDFFSPCLGFTTSATLPGFSCLRGYNHSWAFANAFLVPRRIPHGIVDIRGHALPAWLTSVMSQITLARRAVEAKVSSMSTDSGWVKTCAIKRALKVGQPWYHI